MKKQSDTVDNIQDNKKKRKGLKILILVLSILLAFVIIISVTIFAFLKIGEKQMLNYEDLTIQMPSVAELDDGGKTVYYNGEKYVLNEDVTTILGMGIDKTEFSSENIETYGANGQADSIFLVTIDTKTGETNVIAISRETMVDVDMYSESGSYVGSQKKQLCLAYSYGDGRDFSCENVVNSVKRMIYGLPINSYFAINFESVASLNDAVGGVTVNSLMDFTLPGGTVIEKGKDVTLRGKDALAYVRNRSQVDVDANVARMNRQVQYLRAFTDRALTMTKSDITTPVNLYNAVNKSGDLVTDINVPKLTYITNVALNNKAISDVNFINISGDTVLGEDSHAQFTPNETELLETVLSVFYNKAS